MNKKVRELRALIDEKRNEARTLLDQGNLDEAEQLTEELQEEQRSLTTLLALEESEERNVNQGTNISQREGLQDEITHNGLFIKAIRNQNLTVDERDFINENKLEYRNDKGMSGLTPEDGGLIIPEDVQTRINTLARSFNALENFVNVVPVNTRSGSRVLEKLSEITPFPKIEEMGTIEEIDNPQFTTLSYSIQDYAGILPISRSLLADTDQNLLAYVVDWLGRKVRITRNVAILSQLNKLDKKEIKDIDSIKSIMNVYLDPALSATSTILTNQDGFNYLDQLKDYKGNYLIQPDPVNATVRRLFGRHPIAVISNRFLPSMNNKAPLITGDLTQAVTLFLREHMELLSTTIGGDAFKRNTLDLRVIHRHDCITWDKESAFFGEIDLTEDLPEV